MPTFNHEPWCDPRVAHTISARYYDLRCESEVHEATHAWAQLEQSTDDPEPTVCLHLEPDCHGPYDMDLSVDAATALARCLRDRPEDLAGLLEGLVELAAGAAGRRVAP